MIFDFGVWCLWLLGWDLGCVVDLLLVENDYFAIFWVGWFYVFCVCFVGLCALDYCGLLFVSVLILVCWFGVFVLFGLSLI